MKPSDRNEVMGIRILRRILIPRVSLSLKILAPTMAFLSTQGDREYTYELGG
jgi:hypothetical protein